MKEFIYFAVSGYVKGSMQPIIYIIDTEQRWLPQGGRAISWTEEQVVSLISYCPNHPLYIYIWFKQSSYICASKELGLGPKCTQLLGVFERRCHCRGSQRPEELKYH